MPWECWKQPLPAESARWQAPAKVCGWPCIRSRKWLLFKTLTPLRTGPGMQKSDPYPHYIEFRHVHKTFDRPVLVDSNFHVDPGETVAIIGRSGVGKSVTLSHIMGFLKPDS